MNKPETNAPTQAAPGSNLVKQSLENLDVSKLTPLSPEVMSRQATINVGTLNIKNLYQVAHLLKKMKIF
jgi:hypothetical protein